LSPDAKPFHCLFLRFFPPKPESEDAVGHFTTSAYRLVCLNNYLSVLLDLLFLLLFCKDRAKRKGREKDWEKKCIGSKRERTREGQVRSPSYYDIISPLPTTTTTILYRPTSPPPAMDGLPATAAIAGLLAVSGIVIDILWDLNTSPKHDTAVLNLALREVKECRSSINALTKALALLQSRQVPFPDRASWIDVDELVATLTDAVLAFSKLYALASSIEAEAARSSPAAASRKYEKRLRALCARLKWHNLSIAMMMTIINWCV
jgi:hypothetical protein